MARSVEEAAEGRRAREGAKFVPVAQGKKKGEGGDETMPWSEDFSRQQREPGGTGRDEGTFASVGDSLIDSVHYDVDPESIRKA